MLSSRQSYFGMMQKCLMCTSRFLTQNTKVMGTQGSKFNKINFYNFIKHFTVRLSCCWFLQVRGNGVRWLLWPLHLHRGALSTQCCKKPKCQYYYENSFDLWTSKGSPRHSGTCGPHCGDCHLTVRGKIEVASKRLGCEHLAKKFSHLLAPQAWES